MDTSRDVARRLLGSGDDFFFIPVPNITKSELRRRGKLKISLNGEEILLVYVKGYVYAFQPTCPHQGGPLEAGEIEDLPGKSTCIRCPWHSWRFSISTGECVFPGHSSDPKLVIYPVQTNLEEIRIGFRTLYFNSSF